ncbi:DUF169 domain-containing protein [Methanothrix sp.]|uniref:DUF169 domain-containing protein n=1 Tax=Methanothrix sp. TaxID=90426 RepID=UPI0025D46802|nr:DUF169 domain-containing protein [Methanothrix sp.]
MYYDESGRDVGHFEVLPGNPGQYRGRETFQERGGDPSGPQHNREALPLLLYDPGARRDGVSYLAHADYHECKGGASGLGLVECPENIRTGTLYFNKLHKCSTKEAGTLIAANMPRILPGSTVASYVAPLDKMVTRPDVVILVGNPLQARRIVQAAMFEKGGRATFNTAGIQSFCVDATSSPYLKGEVNVSLGCDGSVRNAGLEDEEVVVGIPYEMMEGICTVLKENYQGWDKFMRG